MPGTTLMFARLASALIAVTIVLATPVQAGEPTFERVFGPEIPTGPYKHPACLEEFDNGDLYLVYYGGQGEYATDTAVFGSRKKKGETAWSTPRVIAHDPLRSVGNGVVWQAPDGVVWLFYVVRDGATWSTSRIQLKLSRDRGETWSDASVLSNEPGMMVRNRPIVLSDGHYLLPAYHETGHDTEAVGPDSTSVFFRFDPKAKTPVWEKSGPIRSARGNIQPAPIELAPGKLVAFCRRGGDYNRATRGFIVRSESSDGGRTWSQGVDSPYPNPNAAVDLLRLRNGHVLLVFNDCFHGRTPLTLAVSTDGAATFDRKRNLVATPGQDYGYPIAFQSRDGRIHVVYTSDRRSVVNHAVLDEDWLLK
ncbi:MAG: sialidase family protein [Isosphaeraceae bacterium]